MQCRSFSAQLGRHHHELQSSNTQVLIILGDHIDRARNYADELKLPFPVLADPERQIYHLYGLHKALLTIQRSAAMLVDREGVVRFVKSVTNPMTWLSENKELYQEVHKSNVTSPKE
jgi:peroxiredoxin